VLGADLIQEKVHKSKLDVLVNYFLTPINKNIFYFNSYSLELSRNPKVAVLGIDF
jgi:hypothetical protein